LQFNKEFWLRFSVFTFDSSVAVVTALVTRQPSALVWGLIAGSVLEVVLTHIFISPRPRLAYRPVLARQILGRGKWVTGARIFQYLFTQGDDVLVGRMLGETSLGFYQMAYRIATLPITEVADVLGKVTFPVYSRISEDLMRLRDAYLKTTLVVTSLVVPAGALLITFTEPIVNLVLGETWLPIVPVLKVLTVYAVIRAIMGPSLTTFLAVKKQEYLTATTFISVFVLALAIFPLISFYGLVGVGLATIIASVASLPLVVYYVVKIFK